MNDMTTASVVTDVRASSPWREAFSKLCSRKLSLASLILVILFLSIGTFAEIYGAYCHIQDFEPAYERKSMDERFQPPSSRHWMGTDYLGRDVMARAIFATKTAVKVGLIASLISAFVGVSLGLAAGYFGGFIDDFAVWIYSTFASMPTLLFILAFSLLVSKGFLFPPLETLSKWVAWLLRTETGMLAIYIGIGLTGWVSLCRVVRGEAMRLREAQYVQAAKALGLRDITIMLRHVLPNLMHLVIVYFTMRFAFAVMTEVIVSYLGFGVQLEPSWGVMISAGQERLWRGVWWELAAATSMMFLLTLSLNILGDALRDALDPRLRD